MPRQKILIVEDDPNIQGFSKSVLESAGFSVDICGTAEAARQSLRAAQPDLVIMDIGLPDGNGLELCRDMGLGQENSAPILFLTARGDLKTRMECFKAGAYDYMQKPFAIEELLARVNVQLRIKKSHDDLVQRNYELELRSRVRQDLTDMLAHDLRAPLSSIKGSIELIRMRGLIDNRSYENLLEQAETAADFMLLMLNDLLDISQAEQIGLKSEIAQTDLTALIGKLTPLFAGRCERVGVHLDVEIADEMKSLRTDSNLLFRILANLIANAVKFSKKGGVVELDCRRRDKYARFTVADRGTGVPNDQKTAIFEKFTTLARKSGIEESSSGIGLTFCRLATEALKGKIWVEDRPGGGALFVLEF